MKYIIFCVLIFVGLVLGQTAEQRKTAELVSGFINILGEDKVRTYIKCIFAQNCANCTSNLDCVWVSASPSAAVSITNMDTKEVALTMSSVNYCWFGALTGLVNQDRWSRISNIEGTIRNGTNSTTPPRYVLETNYGFSDYNWQQCQIRGGAALVLAIGLPIAAVVLCICLICTIVCCCICNKWLAPKRREKRKFKKQGEKL